MLKRIAALGSIVSLCLLWAAVPACLADESEVTISGEEFAKLETFEASALSRADRAFGKAEYRRALAEYDAFILEFSKSTAIPYALVRKGRCLQLDNKRAQAIKQYREVLDYFPNEVKYAALALYYIAQCQQQNGDIGEALKTWVQMAEDAGYSKHPLAAVAVNALADNLAKQEKYDQAVKYYKQVAIDFRPSNKGASEYAAWKVVEHYIRSKPDEKALREFCVKYGHCRAGEDYSQDADYWGKVQGWVQQHGNFPPEKADLRDNYYRYWAAAMEGKLQANDDFQIALANSKMVYEKDPAKWGARLDAQFRAGQKAGDNHRTVKWISLFSANKTKAQEYYGKLDFTRMSTAEITNLIVLMWTRVRDEKMAQLAYGKLDLGRMTNGELIDLTRTLWERVDATLAKGVFTRIRTAELSDNEKIGLAHFFYDRDDPLVKQMCALVADKELGLAELMRYFHWSFQHRGRYARETVETAQKLTGSPKYSPEAWWKMAEAHQNLRDYEKAILSYREANNPPANLFRIADCYVAMGKPEPAIAQLSEIENFFKDQAPNAAMRIAYVHRDFKNTRQYIACLRGVLKKYPKSPQSSRAHVELESKVSRIGGGVDAE